MNMNTGSSVGSSKCWSVVTARGLRAAEHVAATDANTTVFRDVTPCAFAGTYSNKT
jgi:hypothetical protein